MIIARISEIKKVERTGQNILVNIGKLSTTTDSFVCKKCVSKEIDIESAKTLDIISSHLFKTNK